MKNASTIHLKNETGYRSSKIRQIVNAVKKDLEINPTIYIMVYRLHRYTYPVRWSAAGTRLNLGLQRGVCPTHDVVGSLFQFLSWVKGGFHGGRVTIPTDPTYFEPILKKCGYNLLEFPTRKELKRR